MCQLTCVYCGEEIPSGTCISMVGGEVMHTACQGEYAAECQEDMADYFDREEDHTAIGVYNRDEYDLLDGDLGYNWDRDSDPDEYSRDLMLERQELEDFEGLIDNYDCMVDCHDNGYDY